MLDVLVAQNLKRDAIMKFSQYSLALVFFVYQTACGQSLLWRISGNGLTEHSYVYGTIHIKDKRVFVLTDSVYSAQRNTKATVLEIDLGAETSVQVSNLLMLPKEKTLSEFYSPEELTVLQEIVEGKTSVPFSVFNNMRPAALLSVLSESYFSSDMPYALDEYFQRKANEMGKPVIGLETVEEQFDAIAEISPDMIFSYITDTATNEDMSAQMISAYLQADFESLTQLLQADSLTVQYSDKLLRDRNVIMAERIDQLVQTQSCFVAIGAGHLKGELGVLDLLQEKGYMVDPVFGSVTEEPPVEKTVQWNRYEYDRFSVAFPSKPAESFAPFTIEDQTVSGKMLVASDMSQSGIQYFFTELPAIDTVDYEDKLIKASKSAATLFGGDVISTQSFHEDSMRGIETEVSLKSVGLLLQKHIVTNRGYFILQILSPSQTLEAEVKERYFGSFQIIEAEQSVK